MKIGFVATEVGHQRGGGFMGGNVNNVVTVSKALAEMGHDITIITTKPRDAAKNCTEPITWADVFCLDSRFAHGSPGYVASFTRYAVRIIRRLWSSNRIDVVSIHAGFSVWGVIGSLAATIGCPSIHVQYCPIGQPSGQLTYDIFQSTPLSKIWLAKVDRLVAVSENVADSLRKVRLYEQIATIHNAIDTRSYTPAAADRFDCIETDTPTIGYLGSLREQKGLDILVNSFEKYTRDHAATLLLGLEVRSHRSQRTLWQRVTNNSDIHTFGLIPDVPAFLASCDVFVVPFRSTVGPADYPVAALEAMSCACPVIATRTGGLPELISDRKNGLLLDETTSSNLYEQIRVLLADDELRSTLGSNARSAIVSRFSVEQIATQYEQLTRQIIDEYGH